MIELIKQLQQNYEQRQKILDQLIALSDEELLQHNPDNNADELRDMIKTLRANDSLILATLDRAILDYPK